MEPTNETNKLSNQTPPKQNGQGNGNVGGQRPPAGNAQSNDGIQPDVQSRNQAPKSQEPKAGSNDAQPSSSSSDNTSEPVVQIPASAWKDMQEQMARLTAAADQRRLAAYDEALRADGEIIRTCRVNFYDGKPIHSHWMHTNISTVRGSGMNRQEIADQKIALRLFNQDGKPEEGEPVVVDYAEWYSTKFENMKKGEIIADSMRSVRGQKRKERWFTVKLENGRELEINAKYIN